MANIFENRILETSVSTGVGSMALDGAVASYRRFAAALAIGSTCHYLIQSVDPLGRPSGQYEYGRATYSAINTLTRTTVIGSSNADALVDFAAGFKQVSLTVLAPNNDQLQQDWRNALAIGTINYRNLLINGRFVVNQEAKTGVVVLAAGKYGHDGWKAGAGGCTYTFAKVGNLTTITITAGTLQQVVHGRKIDGGNYIMSWTGTAKGRISTGAYASNMVAAASVAAAANLTVEFSTGTLTNVQFEPGTIPTIYENKLPLEDWWECREYFRTSYQGAAPGTVTQIGREITPAAYTPGGNYAVFSIDFTPAMWTTPAFTVYNPATGAVGSIYDESVGGSFAAIGFGTPYIAPNFVSIQVATSPPVASCMTLHYTADARL
ncbi:hypothetical protein [Variovorax sp. PAMC26660]|uniref:hypothetical protein n=1 Tax=Variovorax sp. PAMC26660 TaxID=2762322 RepID=UPI00164E4A20|nr:hypothetical protein [Variovorax sp. PAMC26660]QNK70247.1 hypothetical protein H7F35_11450 [Variovorax sp. PAMC26660]